MMKARNFLGRSSRLFSTVSSKETLQNTCLDLGIDISKPVSGVFDGHSWKEKFDSQVDVVSPTTGEVFCSVGQGSKEDMLNCINTAAEAQRAWRSLPAPKRGEVVFNLGQELRTHLKPLGRLITLEMGKIEPEGVGEVQEYIDVCDFAVGLSRTLEGKVFPSERPNHQLIEMYNPLGSVGIISAFNFPNAVCGWNTAISLVCGNTQVVKGAMTSNLINVATHKMLMNAISKSDLPSGFDWQNVATLCQTDNAVADVMINDPRLDLISFTGSTEVGKHVQTVVGQRFGKSILELGGNNAIVVMDDVKNDPKLMENALRSVLFAAVGTCGQRCTSARRLLLHESIHDEFLAELSKTYKKVISQNIGDPLDAKTLIGPLHSSTQADLFRAKVNEAKNQGCTLLVGGKNLGKNFVEPALFSAPSHDTPILFEENFVPILYATKISSLEEAIKLNNCVEQGLSSALFTTNMRNVFEWISSNGSDTGIVNVNTGCSGAEIGGAFGGNKSTGWGRESGSDSWKQYMRKATCTINYGQDLPLAQGIEFS